MTQYLRFSCGVWWGVQREGGNFGDIGRNIRGNIEGTFGYFGGKTMGTLHISLSKIVLVGGGGCLGGKAGTLELLETSHDTMNVYLKVKLIVYL